MTTIYKLVTQDMKTRVGEKNETEWKINVAVSVNSEFANRKPVMCDPSVIHAYRHPGIAVLLNHVHANLTNPRLFEAEGEVIVEAANKCGVRTLMLTKEIPLPTFSTNQKLEFAIRVALLICTDAVFIEWAKWAKSWLSGEDRSARTAEEAMRVVVRKKWSAAGAAALAADAAALAAAADAAWAEVAWALAADAEVALAADAADKNITYQHLISIIESLKEK